jgi:hypothetical protein
MTYTMGVVYPSGKKELIETKAYSMNWLRAIIEDNNRRKIRSLALIKGGK